MAHGMAPTAHQLCVALLFLRHIDAAREARDQQQRQAEAAAHVNRQQVVAAGGARYRGVGGEVLKRPRRRHGKFAAESLASRRERKRAGAHRSTWRGCVAGHANGWPNGL